MRGIDIFQGDSKDGIKSTLKSIPEKAYKESDFVIVKSTQGVSYKYTSFFNNMIKRALNDGKLAGAYHYAAGNDAIKEADYFVSVVKPYIGKIVLCLDWESYQNKAWGSKTWAKQFIDRVKDKTGITCLLYTGLDGCKQCSNLIGIAPLWFAGYPNAKLNSWTIPSFKYNLGKWKEYAIWQYTSSNEQIDRNTTKWTVLEWKKYATGKSCPEILISLLEEYHKYIKAHSNKFINKYVSSITTFDIAKKMVNKGTSVGITCVVPLRWALVDLGIKQSNGKSIISAPNGSFKSYYTGDAKTYLTRITTGSAIGKTLKQAVDAKLLKPGDIVCYEKLTHTSVYSGNKYQMYEGGGACVVNSHYPNGIVADYSSKYKTRKIAEILRWKDQPGNKSTPTTSTSSATTKTSTGNYEGTYPTLPPRGWYQLNDGISTLTNYLTQIKRVQTLVNWILEGTKGFTVLKADGKYGKLTKAAVILVQKKFGLKQDGEFGKDTLARCKAYKK